MHQDKKQVTPLQFAKRNNKHQIVELLLANGATPPTDAKKKAHVPQTVKTEQQATIVSEPEQPKTKVNEKKIPRRYLLTTLREGGYYEPLTDEEFEQFKIENPDVAKYFLETPDGSEDICPISSLRIPEVNEGVPIYDHWEKAAQRML